MTRTQYYVASSLDGFIADERGKLDWLLQFDDAEGVGEHYERFIADVGALAMGAATYEFILAQDREEWPYGDRKTWVFTHRHLPKIPGADLVFPSGDVRAAHEEMLSSAGDRNVWLVGGGDLVAQFARHDLVDELIVAITPVTLGAGAPLLPLRIDRPMGLADVTRVGPFAVLTYDVGARRLDAGGPDE